VHTPAYCLEDFLHDCNDDSRILVFKHAQQDAGEIFGLYTKQALLEFIANDGLEHMQFINSKDWEKNPDKTLQIFCDSYEFESACKLGYIAFLYSPISFKWAIKSFHLSDNRNRMMEQQVNRFVMRVKGDV
jgi:hypothetical protein